MNQSKNNEELDVKRLNEVIKISRNTLKIVFILAILALLLLVVFLLKETKILIIIKTILVIISPLFIGIVLSWLFEPIIKKLENFGVRRILGSIITYLLFISFIILILYLVIPSFTSQISDFAKTIPDIINWFTSFIDNFFNSFEVESFDLVTTKFQVLHGIEEFGTSLSEQLPDILIHVVKGIINGGINFLVGLVIAFYISLDSNNVRKHFINLIPKGHEKDFIQLFKKLNRNLKDFVYGTLVTSLLVAVLSLIGFLIAGINAPILFAFFCGITNIIPYFGPYIGGIPAIIVAFSISPLAGAITLITVLIVQFVEGNFINPLVMSKAINLHPITIVISLLIFAHFFGIIGMVIATPLISTLKIVFEFIQKKYNIIKVFNR